MTRAPPAPSSPSTLSSLSTTSLVAELDQAFNDLTVAQTRISTVSAILANRQNSLARLPLVVAVPVYSPSTSSASISPLHLAPNGYICRGDRVRVKYPGDWQQNIGIVESFRSGFITVRTPDGHGVKRFEKNLQLIARAGSFTP